MSKQMSATSCSGQALHPVELLRDGKGVFGIIGHGDDDHEPRELILRPDKLADIPRCWCKPIYQQICGGFRHGMFTHTVEEGLRERIHHGMLRRAGLDWPPQTACSGQWWWSDDKKQQDRNRQIYHGLRLGSLSVLNSLVRTALAEAADQDALKMARRFPFKGREDVYTASAKSRRALQLFEVFPVLGLAIYSRATAADPRRTVAIMDVERGRSLRHIAGLMDIPMALRRVKPGAAASAFWCVSASRSYPQICDILHARPDLVHAWLPDTQRKMKFWLQAVRYAADIGPVEGQAFATWTARHVFDLGDTEDVIYHRLADIKDWAQACYPASEDGIHPFADKDDIFNPEPPNVFVTRKFTPRMSLATVLRLSHEWHEAVADSMTGPEFEFPTPWLPAQTVDGLDFLPITHSADLYREGKLMHHCVGTYADAVRRGQSFVYSVRTEGKRVATIELVAHPQQILLGQRRAPCNAAVAPAIEKAAWKWLRQSSIPQNWAEIIGKTSETEHQTITDTGDEIPF